MQAYVARPPLAVVLKEGAIALAPGVGRLKAADYARLVSANQALDHAQARAGALVHKADTVLEDARQSGLQQGREQAREELLSSVAELRAMLGSWVRQTEPRLADIALRCVQEIVLSTDKSALVQDSVHRALAEMSAAPDIRIQVHADHVDELRARMNELIERHALRGSCGSRRPWHSSLATVWSSRPWGWWTCGWSLNFALFSKRCSPNE